MRVGELRIRRQDEIRIVAEVLNSAVPYIADEVAGVSHIDNRQGHSEENCQGERDEEQLSGDRRP